MDTLAFLALLIALLLDSDGCPPDDIVLIAADYHARYADATNGESWALLFDDLQGELDQCRRRNSGSSS